MVWIVKRLASSLMLVWAVATIVFLAIHLVPGDPAELLLSQGGASPDTAQVNQLRAKLGLDRPVLNQYIDTLVNFTKGDLGRSLQDGAPVAGQIALRLPRTLELIGAAGLFAILLGVPLGTLAALHHGRLVDRIISGGCGFILSVPVFVIGTLCVMIFAQQLRLVPAGGYVSFSENPVQHLVLLLMPAFSIGLGLAATVIRMTRVSVLDVLMRDYVRTARAKGLKSGSVLRRHILRNAMMPVVTILALHLGSLLGGTVLIEYVFNWPGLSGYLVSAVNARDYTEVVGCILVISVLFVCLNLLADALYVFLDPRVRA